MKKFALALTALAAFTGSAVAADLPPAPAYSKAPAVVAAPELDRLLHLRRRRRRLGCGIRNTTFSTVGVPAFFSIAHTQPRGGRGYFGTAGAGYDWQLSQRWVFGVFGRLVTIWQPEGQISVSASGLLVTEKSFRIRGRSAVASAIWYPRCLCPMSMPGIPGASTIDYTRPRDTGQPVQRCADRLSYRRLHNRAGFVGGGDEYLRSFSAPGLFMEDGIPLLGVRHGDQNVNILVDGSDAQTGFDANFKPLVQTVSTSLVYRFNWGGPVVAKY